MTTPGTWRPPETKQPPPPKETLETPTRRWPKALIAVVCLLLGMGLGNAFFGGEMRMDNSLDRLEALTGQLDRANAEISRLRGDEALPPALAEARAERAALASELDQAIVDGATLFATGLPESVDRAPASRTVTDLLAAHVAATNARSPKRLLATFTPDGVLTLMAPAIGGFRTEFRGTQIGADFLERERPHLRLTSNVAQHGSFAWARYAESGDEGVVVLRMQHRRIAHAWFVVANAPVGME